MKSLNGTSAFWRREAYASSIRLSNAKRKKNANNSNHGWALHAALSLLLCLMLSLMGARGVFAKQSQQGDVATDGLSYSNIDTYGWYINHKYGYAVAWPKKLLTALGESQAGDGQIFKAPDGQAELRCWARFNSVEDKSLKALFKMAHQEPRLHVTYKHIGKDFFVISGIEDNKIIYRKTIKSNEITATFILTYTKSHSDVFNHVVGDIVKYFMADPEFMYH